MISVSLLFGGICLGLLGNLCLECLREGVWDLLCIRAGVSGSELSHLGLSVQGQQKLPVFQRLFPIDSFLLSCLMVFILAVDLTRNYRELTIV